MDHVPEPEVAAKLHVKEMTVPDGTAAWVGAALNVMVLPPVVLMVLTVVPEAIPPPLTIPLRQLVVKVASDGKAAKVNLVVVEAELVVAVEAELVVAVKG